jgi:hypothetical protein
MLVCFFILIISTFTFTFTFTFTSKPHPNPTEEAIEKIGFISCNGIETLWTITANETLACYSLLTDERTAYWGPTLRETLTVSNGVSVDYLVGCNNGNEREHFQLVTGSFSGEGTMWSVNGNEITPLHSLKSSVTSGHNSSIRTYTIDNRTGTIFTGNLIICSFCNNDFFRISFSFSLSFPISF